MATSMHIHLSIEIKPEGECPRCDEYHAEVRHDLTPRFLGDGASSFEEYIG